MFLNAFSICLCGTATAQTKANNPIRKNDGQMNNYSSCFGAQRFLASFSLLFSAVVVSVVP